MTKTELKFRQFLEEGEKIESKEQLDAWNRMFVAEFKKKLDSLPIDLVVARSEMYDRKKEEVARR